MWFVDSEGNIINSSENKSNFKTLSRKRKYLTKYYIGKIRKCNLGVASDYPTINKEKAELISGNFDDNNRFGFLFNGRDLENNEPIINKYFSNKNEIFCFYGGNIVSPLFLNENEETYCVVRFISWKSDNHKEIIYPEVIYPIAVNEADISSYTFHNDAFLEYKLKKLGKYIPYFNKQPKVRWTK